jgi:hypothetical protein
MTGNGGRIAHENGRIVIDPFPDPAGDVADGQRTGDDDLQIGRFVDLAGINQAVQPQDLHRDPVAASLQDQVVAAQGLVNNDDILAGIRADRDQLAFTQRMYIGRVGLLDLKPHVILRCRIRLVFRRGE